MTTLQERIEHVLRETPIAPAELARAALVSTSAVSQWISGGTKTLKAATAANIERALGWRADWLATGRGTPKAHGVSHATARSDAPASNSNGYHSRILDTLGSSLPVLPWERIDDMNVPNEHAMFKDLEHRAMPHTAGPSAKLVEVNDPAMQSRLNPGDVLQLDPDAAPKPGSIVLVRTSDGRHLVRIYRQRSAGAWSAAPADPNHATLESDGDGLTLIAVATHRIERLP